MLQRGAAQAHVLEQVFTFDGLQRRERGGNRRSMTHECMTVLKKPGSITNNVDDLVCTQRRASGLVTSRETLCHRNDIRTNTFLLVSHHGSSSSGATHDFIEYQVDTVLVAYFPNA